MQTDGTLAGTKLIGAQLKFSYFTAFKDKQFYRTNIVDYPLCTVDINTQNIDSLYMPGVTYVEYRGVFGGLLYFCAFTDATGLELWRSDGTQAGTFLIKDIFVGAGSGIVTNKMFEFKGRVYFEAKKVQTGIELWHTNGSAGNAEYLKQIGPGLKDYNYTGLGPYYSIVYPQINVTDHGFYFPGNDGTGLKMWFSDGTLNGTRPLGDLFQGLPLYTYGKAFCIQNDFYFTAANRMYRHRALQDSLDFLDLGSIGIPALYYAGVNYNFFQDSNALLAFVQKKPDSLSVYRLNSDFSGFTLLNQTSVPTEGSINSATHYVRQFQSRYIFRVKNTVSFDSLRGHMLLYNYKTNQFKQQLNCFSSRMSVSLNSSNLVYNNKLYFPAFGDNVFYEPAFLNLSTDTLERICPDCKLIFRIYDYNSIIYYPLYPLGDRLYFQAYNSSTGNELYVTDFTPQGTGLVKDIFPGPIDGISWSETDYGFLNGTTTANNLIFAARDNVYGAELFCLYNQAPVLSAIEQRSNQIDVRLFPNPCTNELSIRANKTLERIEIIALDGRLVLEKSLHNFQQNTKMELDVNPGVYVVTIYTASETISKKLIVE
jgi:ELWxxDGT repeat protein